MLKQSSFNYCKEKTPFARHKWVHLSLVQRKLTAALTAMGTTSCMGLIG